MEDIRIDPELRDDRDEIAHEVPEVDLPDFNESDFVLPEDFDEDDDE